MHGHEEGPPGTARPTRRKRSQPVNEDEKESRLREGSLLWLGRVSGPPKYRLQGQECNAVHIESQAQAKDRATMAEVGRKFAMWPP